MTVLFKGQYAPTTAAAVYTNNATDSKGAPVNLVIDDMSVHNNDTADHPFTAYIVPNGSMTADTSCCLMEVSVISKQSWLCADMVGKELSPGDSIWVFTDTASMLSIHGSGRRRNDAL